ncbi:MAG: aminotransferase class V-fold PLP-dependent enzyme [Pseudomonadota bacterium]
MKAAIDIEKVRSETPAAEKLIHLNNAGTSLMPAAAGATMLDYLHQEQNCGGYETEMSRSTELDAFYDHAARLVGCDADEIAFFEGATKAWQQFFYAVPMTKGQRIVTTQTDYGSNFVGYLHRKKRDGVDIDIIECDANGDIDLEQMRRAVDDRTALIAISHIPTGSGLINPARDVGNIARDAGVPYLLDACQSVGQIQVDVSDIGCTALSVTGRKYLRGPRGTGFLYVNRAALSEVRPQSLDQRGVTLHDDSDYTVLPNARCFENYERSMAAMLGLSTSIQYALDLGMESIEQRIRHLGAYLRAALEDCPGATCEDMGSSLGGIVSISIPGVDPEEVRAGLHDHSINVWVSSGAGSLVDFQRRGIHSLIRASVHYFNTEDEIDQLIKVLKNGF